MSRIHEERKDFYSSREGVLTSSSNIRSIATLSQNMDKDKVEKPLFGQPAFVSDSGFRTVDLLKPAARTIVPASLGGSGTQLHAMPHLVTNYMALPLNQSLVRGQHAFQAHIPVNLGTAQAIAPPRVSVTSQRLPLLKPTNLPSQIQLQQLPLLPPSVGASNHSGSPTVTSHGLTSDSRLDSRTTRLSDPHSALRGNIQATTHNTTIQVIASGTAAQVHLPTSILSKSSSFSSSPNMLKIGVSSHSNVSSGTVIPASPFKLGIGKAYPGSSSVIIPVSSNTPKQEELPSTASFNRFSTSHSVAIPTHHISNFSITTTVSSSQAIVTTTSSTELRTHTIPNQYQPITAAYVFHDIGPQIGMHSFPHQLVRPPSTSAVPLFTVDSPHGLPTVPVVSIAVTKGHIIGSESSETSRSESLAIRGNSSFSIQNLYPNLQTNNIATTFSSTTTPVDSSVRPSILRKRPAETTTLFPVQPTEKERISSPIKKDRNNSLLSTRILSPPNLTSNNEKMKEIAKPINHSIQSITSTEIKNPTSPTLTMESLMKTTAVTTSTLSVSVSFVKTTATVPLLLSNSVSGSTNLPEVSPKKKPRKQLIITTEDKYGTTPINSACGTDEDEEFLKSNETMKDLTPPKLTPAVQSPSVSSNSTAAKQLYTSSPPNIKPDFKTEIKQELKAESSELQQRNGLVAVSSTETKASDVVKYFRFRSRPQVSIINDCKINTKAAHNHFYRYSDVRVKEEKKTTTQDKMLVKTSMESASGWRIHHLSTQLDDLVSLENGICDEILKCKEIIPQPNLNSPTSHYRTEENVSEEDTELRMLHELIQGSIQRCRCSIEQLEEAKTSMFKLLDHRPKAMETLKRYKQKFKSKKKVSS